MHYERKEKILLIIREIIFQFREIILKSPDKRSKITIFSPDCPICKEYLGTTRFKFMFQKYPYSGCDKCFMFDCKTFVTKPMDKTDIEQLKIRLKFWLRVNKELTHLRPWYFLPQNRWRLQDEIKRIDMFFNINKLEKEYE
jgi:hypothetical protein